MGFLDMITDLWTDGWVGRGLILLLIVGVAVMAIAAYALCEEQKEWNKYAAEHCKIVGRISGDTFVSTGIGANGQLVTSVGTTAEKTGYACDDGVTYWR